MRITTCLLFAACAAMVRPLAGQDTAGATHADSGCIVASDSMTTPPQLKKAKPPRYPDGLRNGGVQGNVRMRFVIGCDGKVRKESVEVLSASRPEFVEPAVESVLKSEFTPGRRNGRVIAVYLTMEVQFRLNERRRPGVT